MSSIDHRLEELHRRERSVRELLQSVESLRHGGGGGTSGGMEERVAKLEAGVEHLQGDVVDLRGDMKTVLTEMATLKENVRHLPTKPWLFTTLVGILAALSAIVAVIVRFVPAAG